MTRRAARHLAVAATVTTALLAATACSGTGTITLDRSVGTTTTIADEAPAITPDADLAGAPDVGDTVLPGAGNGGYDVEHYDLDIEVLEGRREIAGTTTITATATQDLSSFNLDLHALEVEEVTVEELPAEATQDGDEVTVVPEEPIIEGDLFTVVVTYSGTPTPVQDPGAPGTIGWLSAPSGTYVASEPTGAKGFFPCNDHPSDKATFGITVTASTADTVVANGTLASKEPVDGERTRWSFAQSDPMATYLVQIAVGEYDLIESTGPHGLPIRHAVVRHVSEAQREVLGDTAAQIEFFEPMFGPFPLDNYGLLVADSLPEFALETQTLTLLPADWLTYGRESASSVMAHELAHQWFGDAVTPARWSDIWLNEGFATYGEWMWNEHVGSIDVASQAARAMDQADSWRENFGPVAQPTAEGLFSPNQYDGAAIVLHALRKTIGDDAFFTVLRTWMTERDGTSVTTEDFEATAQQVSGRDLGAFFDAWLRSTTLPEMPG